MRFATLELDCAQQQVRSGNDPDVRGRMRRFSKMWFMRMVEYAPALERSEGLAHAIVRMNNETGC